MVTISSISSFSFFNSRSMVTQHVNYYYDIEMLSLLHLQFIYKYGPCWFKWGAYVVWKTYCMYITSTETPSLTLFTKGNNIYILLFAYRIVYNSKLINIKNMFSEKQHLEKLHWQRSSTRRLYEKYLWHIAWRIETPLWEENVAWGLKLKWFSCFQYNSSLLAKTEVEM